MGVLDTEEQLRRLFFQYICAGRAVVEQDHVPEGRFV